MLRLAINGSRGRVGRRIDALAKDDNRFDVTARFGRHDAADDARFGAGDIDVIIDFSTDDGARRAAQLAQRTGCALLVGTTGLNAETLDRIDDSARSAPLIVAPNTSRGIAVMTAIVTDAARRLGDAFDIDLVEYHHAGKRDAPSGTALRIAGAMRDQGGAHVPPERVHSIRAGDIFGDHQVQFTGPGERLKIFHLVTDRDVFARGALDAAAWLANKKAGCYTIEQALGIDE